MTISLNLTISDFEKQLAKTYEAMGRLFKSAFGVSLEDRFSEVEESFSEAIRSEAATHLLLLQGVIDRDTEEFLDEDGNTISDLSGTTMQICMDAIPTFLAKVKPASVYNENILYNVAYCWLNLNAARSCLETSQNPEALHFLICANQELGQADMLLALRERGRERAIKGGKQRHASTQEEKERARTIYRDVIAGKGLSNEQAASKLLSEFRVRYNRGGIKRLISETRKKMESES